MVLFIGVSGFLAITKGVSDFLTIQTHVGSQVLAIPLFLHNICFQQDVSSSESATPKNDWSHQPSERLIGCHT
jgi:hypothetical protein